MANIASDYSTLLETLKDRIRSAQVRAALTVNRELVLLYWQIGQEILARQNEEGWGTGVINQLSKDLQSAFPEMKGFSARNLGYMKVFAATYSDDEFLQQVVAKLPWGHNVRLLDKVSDSLTREWYARKTIEHGWSRAILEAQIETKLHLRQGVATTNFTRTLPTPQSELAQQLLKDPYNFDFLSLHDEAVERDLEQGLLRHLEKFMLELGAGFAFVGRQYHLEVGGEDFYLDLLFYHLKLRCFVVVELKAHDFKPEYAGKLNFYLSAADDLLRHPSDNPTVGILLCKGKNKVLAEYALRDINKPLGVADYQLAEALPKELEGTLPSIAQLEAALEQAEHEE